jgi:single-strand DNA-binding protein
MAVGNTVTIVGNVTRDPELRFTNSGMAVASFGVAINNGKRNQQTGQWEDGEPSFFDVSCFAQLADNVAESVQKGTRVVVTGRLNQRSWQTEGGDKRSKVEVVADEVAPSLRWATAAVQRNERREGFEGGGSGGGAARSSSGGGGAEPAADYPMDEEPF